MPATRNRLIGWPLSLTRRIESHRALIGARLTDLDEISAWKKQNRTTTTQPDLSDRLRYLRTGRKSIFGKIKAVKKAAKEDPSIKPLIEKGNTAVDAAIKEADNWGSTGLTI
jgi:hypothetical protein